MIREVVSLDSANPYAKRLELYLDDLVIGYLDYSLIYDRMEIDNFFVEEAYRKCGYGTKLLSFLVVKAIEAHVINITLEVRESNEVARSLYKEFGFREVALRKFYYGEEHGILMEKQVM